MFQTGDNCVPYFNTVLTAHSCAEMLQLAGQCPEFTLSSGNMDSLFQRDIDWSRVVDMSSRYLTDQKNPAFFNSITIALIPVEGAESLERSSEDLTEHYPNSASSPGVRVSWQVGDKVPENGSIAQLYWDKKDVRAVAIDGQHRLASLMRFASDNRSKSQQIGVPVIILLLDGEYGLSVQQSDLAESKLALVRKLFIDLNKHARTVDRTRQLLLDDRDSMAISMRKMMSATLEFSASGNKNLSTGLEIGHEGEFENCLPLSCIDWHTGNAKVDTGPYLVSVLGLEWVLKKCCEESTTFSKSLSAAKGGVPFDLHHEIKKAEDAVEDNGKDVFATIESRLQKWSALRWQTSAGSTVGFKDEIQSAKESLKDSYSPSSEACHAVADRIAAYWSENIVHLFSNIDIYKRVIQTYFEHGMLTTNFVTYYQKFVEAQNEKGPARKIARDALDQLNQSLNQKSPGLVENLQHGRNAARAAKLYQGDDNTPYVLFSQTGQRAMVLGYIQFSNFVAREPWLRDLAGKLNIGDGVSDHLLPAHLYTLAINDWSKVLDGQFFTKLASLRTLNGESVVWQGSLFKQNETAMEFSLAAAQRGKSLFTFISLLWCFRRLYEAVELDWESVVAGKKDEKLSQGVGSCLLKAFHNVSAWKNYGKEENADKNSIRRSAFGYYSMGYKRTGKNAGAGLSKSDYRNALLARVKHLSELIKV